MNKKKQSEISIDQEQASEQKNGSEQEKASEQLNTLDQEHALELLDMSRKERRRYKAEQEKKKLSELSFWRKIQYILMYYTGKFLAVVAGCAIIALIIHQVYIATRPVALRLNLVNDMDNLEFAERVEAIYQDYYEVPEDALFYIDSSYSITPGETLTSLNTSYYTKMMSSLTQGNTHIVICDSAVVDYYAIDGYFLELHYSLPADILEQVSDRLYECDGPVEDSDYYALDLSGMAFTKATGIQLEHPYLCIPTCLEDEKRETAYNFIRMILQMEENESAE